MHQNFRMIAKTFSGLESVLARELGSLGAENIELLKRAVSFHGNTKLLYSANFYCRTALEILVPIHGFKFTDEKDYYHQIYQTHWDKYLNTDSTLLVDSTVHRSSFNHTKYVSQLTKDAIVDQFKEKYNKRPSVDTSDPDLRINIHIAGQNCSVSLNSSGIPLFKRGYRQKTGPAPLNEVVAAGLIMLSEWDQTTDFYDLMCGSGTILIEAALMAHSIPSGSFRKSFGFEKWKDFDESLWEKIIDDARVGQKSGIARICGSDISRRMIEISEQNIRSAGVDNLIDLKVLAIEDCRPDSSKGFIIMNPPYGERMTSEDTGYLYQQIGDVLKKHYTNHTAWLLTSDMEALKRVGLRPSKKITVYNGPLECKFVKFEMYKGSKKTKHTKQ